ncbi:MAG: (d)CMP kinase [Pseudomonadota bacterium]|nr:(d)CMP kinase [Pseudomonadota bacterium]
MGKRGVVVTVDGPGGSGKGTISHLMADKLGYRFLDSGSLYRLTALAATRAGVALDDSPALCALARALPVAFRTGVDGEPVTLLDGLDVGTEIRSEACGNAASRVAADSQVRTALLERQRAFAGPPGLVADGRDMGTVVFPQADTKIFLTASLEERARRRYKQLKEKGVSARFADLLSELAKRDERDANREVAPLRPADDATILDSTGLSISEVLEQALACVSHR